MLNKFNRKITNKSFKAKTFLNKNKCLIYKLSNIKIKRVQSIMESDYREQPPDIHLECLDYQTSMDQVR